MFTTQADSSWRFNQNVSKLSQALDTTRYMVEQPSHGRTMICMSYRSTVRLLLCVTVFSGCESRPAVSHGDTAVAVTPGTNAGQSVILVTGDSVGPLTLHVSLSDLYRLTRLVRDTTEGCCEGDSMRVLIVLLDGDTVRAMVDNSGRVDFYSLSSARFRTRDSLGAGSSLSQLLRVPGVHAFSGEGSVTVHFPKHCGLFFHISADYVHGASDSVGPSELRQLPENTHVTELGVGGCKPKGTAAPPT